VPLQPLPDDPAPHLLTATLVQYLLTATLVVFALDTDVDLEDEDLEDEDLDDDDDPPELLDDDPFASDPSMNKAMRNKTQSINKN